MVKEAVEWDKKNNFNKREADQRKITLKHFSPPFDLVEFHLTFERKQMLMAKA